MRVFAHPAGSKQAQGRRRWGHKRRKRPIARGAHGVCLTGIEAVEKATIEATALLRIFRNHR